jgi:hypothetical protein
MPGERGRLDMVEIKLVSCRTHLRCACPMNALHSAQTDHVVDEEFEKRKYALLHNPLANVYNTNPLHRYTDFTTIGEQTGRHA